ncbi:MAG: DegV family protein [Erysipelotrichaceae bacterium]
MGDKIMVKIITDSSSLYTPAEAASMGFTVIPLVVNINNETYRDLAISSKDFMGLISQGHIPTSSQPPIGEVMEVYEQFQGEDVVNICMADGLSGTYQSAVAAKEGLADHKNIHVVNSKTLCGPQRYIVEKALALANEGKSVEEVIAGLQPSIASATSFLIPYDFAFLKRGGRLSPAAATVGGILKLKPVMQTVQDGARIDKFHLARTLGSAADSIVKYAKQHGFNSNYICYVSDADNKAASEQFVARLHKDLPEVEVRTLDLGAAFITQGGPQCIAIQFVKK